MVDIIRVLVVDDSALMRKLISDILSESYDIEVVGTAQNGEAALQQVEALRPDIVTLDIEMPVMNGLQFLKELNKRSSRPRVIVISTLTSAGSKTAIEALDLGAVDVVHKPAGNVSTNLDLIKLEMLQKVKNVARISENEFVYPEPASARPPAVSLAQSGFSALKRMQAKTATDAPALVGLGISTGGPRALRIALPQLAADFPLPILIVQHIPRDFVPAFAESLNDLSALRVKVAEDGEEIVRGTVYIAQGERHMGVETAKGKLFLTVHTGLPVSGHLPSVDYLFDSINEATKGRAIAIVMTGMGSDGANGVKRLHDSGAYTIAQNKETSTVFGMPRVAIEKGGIDETLPLEEIMPHLSAYVASRVPRS